MCTLIKTGNSQGETRRCDARCYNAHGPDCVCCCGGRNHGSGLDQAVENMQEAAEDILKDWKKANGDQQIILEPLLF